MNYYLQVPENFSLFISSNLGEGMLHYKDRRVVLFSIENDRPYGFRSWHIYNPLARLKVRRIIQKAMENKFPRKGSLSNDILLAPMVTSDGKAW